MKSNRASALRSQNGEIINEHRQLDSHLHKSEDAEPGARVSIARTAHEVDFGASTQLD
jgi:hypothetical protein